MPRLSVENRQRVVRLFKDGHRPTEILARLEEEDIRVSKVALYALLKKYRETGRVEDRARARAPKKLSDVHYSFIDSALQQDDELTTAKLYDQLLESFPDITASKSTVKRARRELGWVTSAPKYCQLIRDNNKQKQLDWCRKVLDDKDEFRGVIWTDESTVMIDPYSRKYYRKRGEARKLKARPKHPAKIHVWGGISPRGATPLVIFSGIMISTRYVEILQAGLVPFIQETYPEGHRFQQDNDPKHCSRYTQSKLEELNINWWKTPPESPDMNPIENVWGSMKTFLRNEYKPRTLDALKNGIRVFWKTLTPAVCQRYVNHLHRVIPKVIEMDGAASGF